MIITDTVGFISDLPADLVTALRATLEELADADLLLHVVDAADPRVDAKVESVEALLHELELPDIPVLRVLNKSDLLTADEAMGLESRFDGVSVSATERTGLGGLIEAAEERLDGRGPLLGGQVTAHRTGD